MKEILAEIKKRNCTTCKNVFGKTCLAFVKGLKDVYGTSWMKDGKCQAYRDKPYEMKGGKIIG